MKIDAYNNKVKDSGGNAFPFVAGQDVWTGMTLRDYFAAKAMQAIISTDEPIPCDMVAIDAYRYADSMLKERSK